MYILEGRYTFWVGDRVLSAEAGTFVFLPRDVPHCLRVEGDTPGRLLQLTLPAGLEEGFAEMGRPPPPRCSRRRRRGRPTRPSWP